MNDTNKYEDRNIIFEEIARVEFDIDVGSYTVVFVIGKPQNDLEKNDIYCPYNIEMPNERIKRWAPGVDSVSALQNAMRMIHMEIKTRFIKNSKSLSRKGFKNGDLGMPEWDLFFDKMMKDKT